MQRHALTDAQWKKLQPLLPRRAQGRKSTPGERHELIAAPEPLVTHEVML